VVRTVISPFCSSNRGARESSFFVKSSIDEWSVVAVADDDIDDVANASGRRESLACRVHLFTVLRNRRGVWCLRLMKAVHRGAESFIPGREEISRRKSNQNPDLQICTSAFIFCSTLSTTSRSSYKSTLLYRMGWQTNRILSLPLHG
jgi:hypothetical protein